MLQKEWKRRGRAGALVLRATVGDLALGRRAVLCHFCELPLRCLPGATAQRKPVVRLRANRAALDMPSPETSRVGLLAAGHL